MRILMHSPALLMKTQ